MAKDMFHQAVKNALVKEQWTITADPLRFQYGDRLIWEQSDCCQPIEVTRKSQSKSKAS